MKVSLIAAVGRSGQMGLKGELPWKNSPVIRVQDQMKADLRLFRHLTFGKDLIMGERTAKNLKLDGRTVHVYRGEDPAKYMHDLEKQGIEELWIAGGAFTYAQFAIYVNHLKLISFIDFNGHADTYFPSVAFGMTWGEWSSLR